MRQPDIAMSVEGQTARPPDGRANRPCTCCGRDGAAWETTGGRACAWCVQHAGPGRPTRREIAAARQGRRRAGWGARPPGGGAMGPSMVAEWRN